jgi:IMP dehydrogenase
LTTKTRSSWTPGATDGFIRRRAIAGFPAAPVPWNIVPDRIPEGLTFDDVLLLPARSAVLFAETETRTLFTRNIPLNIPVTSSAMDTVTKSHPAIALAQQGGSGVIHRNMSIERQAEEVDRVKRAESGMIVEPPSQKVTSAPRFR